MIEPEDSAFIAACDPDTIRSLLDAVKRLRDELAEIRSELYCHGSGELDERLSVKANNALTETAEWAEDDKEASGGPV